jgi:uncharacterized protein YaaN involved in tellurite resistance
VQLADEYERRIEKLNSQAIELKAINKRLNEDNTRLTQLLKNARNDYANLRRNLHFERQQMREEIKREFRYRERI